MTDQKSHPLRFRANGGFVDAHGISQPGLKRKVAVALALWTFPYACYRAVMSAVASCLLLSVVGVLSGVDVVGSFYLG